MTCCSKKRRLCGKTDTWWNVQSYLAFLLSGCLQRHPESTGDPKINVFLDIFDPYVTKTLMGHLVGSLAVDAKIFLNVKSPLTFQPEEGQQSHVWCLKAHSLMCLAKFVQLEVVGEAFVTEIGEIVVPAGAPGLSGRKFAECFLDGAAKFVSMFELSKVRLKLFQYIYEQLLQCPQLRAQMHIDEVFRRIDNDSALGNWAKDRLTGNIT